MHFSTSTLLFLGLLTGTSLSAPLNLAVPVPVHPRQNALCFIVGSTALPAETQASADSLASNITCDATTTTIGKVPDVSSGGVSFSSVNFANSTSTPLQFALDKFATASPLASTDLAQFQNDLNVYVATEAGVRSESGSLAIKVPKFFLSFQVARIKTAQGVKITDAGQTVEHLLGKVQTNAKGESQVLLDQVTALSTTLK